MVKCRNAMEDVVTQYVDKEMQNTGCCTCEACRDDVITYSLNRLPPKYSSTRQGELITLIGTEENQQAADIVFVISEGCKVVRENPRHDTARLEENVK